MLTYSETWIGYSEYCMCMHIVCLFVSVCSVVFLDITTSVQFLRSEPKRLPLVPSAIPLRPVTTQEDLWWYDSIWCGNNCLPKAVLTLYFCRSVWSLISMAPLMSPELLRVCEHLLAEWADWLWEGIPRYPSDWIRRGQLFFQLICLCPVLLLICVHHVNNRWSVVSRHCCITIRSRTRFWPGSAIGL